LMRAVPLARPVNARSTGCGGPRLSTVRAAH
jgi:hypothetical protein